MPSKKKPNRTKSKASKHFAVPGSYEKLINRLYEPLLLLTALDPVRGDHTTPSVPGDASELAQRTFQDDLAFMCEYDKGGDACTALAIEERETFLVYWVAANTDPKNKIAPFLEKVLEFLSGTLVKADDYADKNKESLTTMCILFALPKIKKLYKLLCAAVKDTNHRLQSGGFSEQEQALTSWLQQFSQGPRNLVGADNKEQESGVESGVKLCRLAYEERMSAEMDQLKELTTMAGADGCFAKVRHYIGRLAHHVRVPARLLLTVHDLEELLCNPYRVLALPVTQCVPFQLPRSVNEHGQAILKDIALRMSHSTDPDLYLELTTSLCELDRQYGVGQEYCQLAMDNWEKQPRVHAEIQILEHFHSQNLKWAGNGGRIIGCIYPKWGPPLLAGGTMDPGYIQQRDLLNFVIADMRKDVVDHIRSRRSRNKWHADTRTEITQAIDGKEAGSADSMGCDGEIEDSKDSATSVTAVELQIGSESGN
ncbi:hypothetical protein SBRCBS47491_002358, partial [Sporothrix bragantina]